MTRVWIVFLSVFFNFCYGILIPVIPRLELQNAGLAFSSFALIKIFVLLPMGLLSDRIGHKNGLTISLVFQALGLGLLLGLPSHSWIGRAFEGLSLALGQVSALSLARFICKDLTDFKKFIGYLLGIGSSGYLFGPLAGYLLIKNSVELPIQIAVLSTMIILIVQIFWAKNLKLHLIDATQDETPSTHEISQQSRPTRVIWAFAFALGAAKALGMGLEPLIGWWSTEIHHFLPLLSGATFVLLGVLFGIGNFLSRPIWVVLGIPALVLLEQSLSSGEFASIFWWSAMATMGFWSGSLISLCVAQLGWNDPTKIGRSNSLWITFTDIPMAVLPALIWEFREPSAVVSRFALTSSLVLTAMLALPLGFYWLRSSSGDRSHTENLQPVDEPQL